MATNVEAADAVPAATETQALETSDEWFVRTLQEGREVASPFQVKIYTMSMSGVDGKGVRRSGR